MLTEMNLYLKRSSDVECVAETQLVNDKKLAKERKNVHEEDRGGSIKDNTSARRLESAHRNTLSTTMTTRQHLEAVKRKIVAKDEESRRQSIESAGTNAVISNIPPKNDEDSKLPEWPDADGSDHAVNDDQSPRISDVSNKENWDQPPPQGNERRASSDAISDVSSSRMLVREEADVSVAGIELADTQYQKQKSWLTSYREKQAMGATSLLDQSIDSQPDEQVFTEEQSRPTSDSNTRRLSLRESIASSVRRTSLLDTVTENERISPNESDTPLSRSGRKHSMELPTPVADECAPSTVPWANVKLRPARKPITHQSKQQDNVKSANSISASTAEHHAEVDGQRKQSSTSSSLSLQETYSEVPPWTPVKLRSVTKSQDATSDTGSDHSKQDYVMSFRKQLRKLPSELNAVKRKEKESQLAEQGITMTPEKKSLADLSWAPVSNQMTPPKPRKSTVCGIRRGDDVDLRNLPVDAFGSENDMVIVDLDRIPGMPEEHKLSVIVGKNMLLEARTVDGEQLSRVNWRVARSDVKSLTLDMADRRADIALAGHESKSLVFDSAEGCLRFASAFYETAKESSTSSDDNSSDPVSDDVESVHDHNASVPASEQLTDEEQRLLKAFRQKRRTKSSAEAMRESIAAAQSDWDDGPETDMTSCASVAPSAQSKLSDDEEKVAATYQKMLKFKVPPEAVRHKMSKDGVDEKIIAAVLSSLSKESKASSGGLSAEDEKVAESYRKMLKMQIPPEAVRHKMTKDQVDSRIIDAVLGPSPEWDNVKQQKQINLSEDEEKLATSYRKMLKMMIPAEAVRHKMKKDQASNNVTVAVFGPEVGDSAEAKEEQKVALSVAEEAIASSYRKMLKMMIPPDAVRHKMRKDQVDLKIIMAVLGPDPDEEKRQKVESSLSEADEQIAATYRKMLRMKVPTDGVRHKMIKNGVSEHIIAAVLGVEITKAKQATTKQSAAHGNKLVSLHWTPLSGEALDNSVWRAPKKRKATVAQPEGSDISKLVELFQKKTNKKAPSAADGTGGSGKGDDMAKLIDLNRANNVAISLKAFKDLSHVELAETIAHLDPLQRITGERVQFMKDLLPTATEVKVIKAYKGDESRLVPAEVFFTKMVTISRLQTKIQVMQTMSTLNDNASGLGKNFVLLETVCSQIMNSEKLEEVLDMVLQIGNIMNEGTRTGGAAGFKFDSLLKLTQTKSSDGKMTVLDYIVMIFVAKDKREVLQLTADFPDCQAASRMLITEMVNDVTSMNAALKKCETELENLKKDNGEIPIDCDCDSDPRAALMAAIKKKASGGNEPQQPTNFAKRAAFFAAIEAQKSPEHTELDGIPNRKPVHEPLTVKRPFVAKDASLKSGIQRLEAFVSDAKDVLRRLEEERDRAIDACKSLSRYCGESGGERATSTLLGILAQFATNLDIAVKKHDERKEAELRREAAAQKKGQRNESKSVIGKSAKKSAEPNTRGQSLVLMVNELLKEAPEDAKEDFKKGVVYEDPDEKLRAIYKKERESLGIFVPPEARKPSQVDLLIAIKKRRERADARRENSVSSATGVVVTRRDEHSTQGCNIGGCIN